ncbi:hypothetical protein E6Q11_00180 [Candidatus Dojkabacteria bacterium]|uniref:Uncharacterized protein n=1 Tax=Candidatus Dojkabacteria bacterium TaxID=2099670 RepID=A0A5C7JBD8_9BACT|nr:MAG: hypothetical protein E6Q11_00180 [Candidatus Dojkabacteria bacterium]
MARLNLSGRWRRRLFRYLLRHDETNPCIGEGAQFQYLIEKAEEWLMHRELSKLDSHGIVMAYLEYGRDEILN